MSLLGITFLSIHVVSFKNRSANQLIVLMAINCYSVVEQLLKEFSTKIDFLNKNEIRKKIVFPKLVKFTSLFWNERFQPVKIFTQLWEYKQVVK